MGELGKKKVYVSAGEYLESFEIDRDAAIVGMCEQGAVVINAPPRSKVVVSSSANASINNMTLRNVGWHEPGVSVFGVMVRSGRLDLANVEVIAGDAPSGVDGAPGIAGAPGGQSCTPGNGSDGAPGRAGGAGSFDREGFVAPIATQGANGQNGSSGALTSPQCVACVKCELDDGKCKTRSEKPSCGTQGRGGCGGEGGRGGAPGMNGASSVALFVWNADVFITGGSLRAGDAGSGGAGGEGGAGGPGAAGAAGSEGPLCSIACGIACLPQLGRGGPGQGAAGAPGGRGGQGGAGAGGSSYAVVAGDRANVSIQGALLAHGSAGKSRGDGAPGSAGERWP